MDFVSADILMPVGALLTSLFVGWVLPQRLKARHADVPTIPMNRWLFISLRYICPIAILVVLIKAFVD